MRKGRLEDPEHMHAPTKASLKAWWQSFTFAQKMKKDSESAALNKGEPVHTVFGKPLKESLKYANVQISTANANGELYVWGYIPVVVAKCGLFLKENATEVEGVFRVNGSAKRMRELQAAFETPPRYGKSLDWKQETYTPHDVASVFRRYLTQMPEPVIPHNLYHEFRAALGMGRLPLNSDKNRMTATNLAVIFRPGIISHPTHEMLPNEHHLSQKVLEFLIEHQDWFMLDIPPPPQGPEVDERGSTGAGSGGSQPTAILRPGFGGRRTGDGGGGDGHGLSSSGAGLEDHDLHIIPSSDEERDHSSSVSGGWKLIVRGERGDKEGQGKVHRRRTLASPTTPTRPTSGRRDRGDGGVLQEESLTPPGGSPGVEDGGLSPVAESPTGERGFGFAGALGVSRSRTLPTGRRRGPGEDGGGSRGLEKGSEKDRARVLRKQKRASSSQSRVPTTGALQIDTSHSAGR
ncbi:hypothetical protein EYR38_007594 [Pleurotus pulmonarius]|nr:hypothetical protein EYR38_007594 [Pleurotus pulmonarius]